MEPLGYLPPAEYEANYDRQQTAQVVAQIKAVNSTSLLDTRGVSHHCPEISFRNGKWRHHSAVLVSDKREKFEIGVFPVSDPKK